MSFTLKEYIGYEATRELYKVVGKCGTGKKKSPKKSSSGPKKSNGSSKPKK